MTSEQFCYWLQGYFELKQTIDHREGATPETMKMIEEHLQTVFVKVTPPFQLRTTGPNFADPARQMTPLEMLERGQSSDLRVTC